MNDGQSSVSRDILLTHRQRVAKRLVVPNPKHSNTDMRKIA